MQLKPAIEMVRKMLANFVTNISLLDDELNKNKGVLD